MMKKFIAATVMMFVVMIGLNTVQAQETNGTHDEHRQVEEVAHQGGGHGDQEDETHEATGWWFLIFVGLMTAAGAYMASQHFFIKDEKGNFGPALTTLQIFSVFLLFGTVAAQFWAHGNPHAYHATMHKLLYTLHLHGAEFKITFHFIVNDVFMALFFGIAAKELAEAIFKEDGALYGTKGFLPGLACLGGVFGPAVVFRSICTPEMVDAWAVPCATDIAFAWLGARAIWGKQHPAVIFLLALAIGDDFIGMGIIAGFYPQHDFHLIGIAYLLGGVGLSWLLRKLAHDHDVFQKWQWYIFVAGPLCWIGLLLCGLHAALALVFVVPLMPMAGRDYGIFAPGESSHHHDTINNFEHAWKPFVDVGLCFFGIANAGVAWIGQGAWDQNSWAVFLGLGIGKVVGITLFAMIGVFVFRLRFPVDSETGATMGWRDVFAIGILGAMGFTVALFVADAAGGAISLKLGALASFSYLAIGIAFGKLFCKKAPVSVTK